MIDEISKRLTTDMVAKIDSEMCRVLDKVHPGWAFVDVRNRCRIEHVVGLPFETLYFDDTPLLEIHPVQVTQELRDEKVVVRLTQNIRRLI